LIPDENGEGEAEHEKQGTEIDGAALEDVGGASTEHLVCHAGSEGCAEPFLFWPLHQNQQGH
jgi:hypothetical protein